MHLNRHCTIIALAFTAVAASASFAAPASAADPVCQFGFKTVEKKSWLLKCRKTALMAYKGTLLTEANNANCTPNSYWNFGPKVTAKHLRRNTVVRVEYLCGHVES